MAVAVFLSRSSGWYAVCYTVRSDIAAGERRTRVAVGAETASGGWGRLQRGNDGGTAPIFYEAAIRGSFTVAVDDDGGGGASIVVQGVPSLHRAYKPLLLSASAPTWLRLLCHPRLLQPSRTNYSEMDQITSIILDKENIPPDTHMNDIHVGIGAATIDTGTNYSKMDQTTPVILDNENIPPDAHGNHNHVGIGTTTTTGSALSVANDIANDKMDKRNAQQRKQRAEMTDEQREESKRRHREYQRQYRA
ncbi:uncharacterized protein [Miscanthus floridulus]|uniref:uncharacterized protein isoform X2 n=1 Tax=Miscanthus floridulus TaxID=154761 RepID=UPI00345A8A84